MSRASEPASAEAGPTGERQGADATHPRRMLDRYEILAEIAQGGMGTVYLARLGGAGGFERLFAIKLMHEHLAREETFVAMLLDEARTAAHIHHPNAVGIIDVAESPVGHYLVMSYVDGFSLAQLLAHPELQPRDRIRVAARLVADAAHGLHGAHTAKNAKGERLGIVHRDVSPQNILVGTDGMGRIVDFGIALAASRIVSSRPGVLKGKPSYMAPEQARGEPCDARADVFALGIVLWEAVTGRRLFYAEMDLATLVQVMECQVDPPTCYVPDLPEELSDMILKALRREPGERYQTARDFAVALERAAERAGLLATAHEVEEVVAHLFADEIAARQAAISQRLAASVGPPQPLDRAGLASVSRLVEAPRRAGPSGQLEAPPTRAERPGMDQRSGVRVSATPRTPSEGAHRIVAEPGVDAHARTKMSVSPPAPAGERVAAWKVVLGAVVVLVAVAVAGFGAAVLGGSGAGAEAEAEAARAGAGTDSEAATEPEAATATRAATESEVATGTATRAATEPATATEPEAATEFGRAGTGVEAGPGGSGEAGRAGRASRGGTRREQGEVRRTAQGSETPPERAAPRLEANPYLTH